MEDHGPERIEPDKLHTIRASIVPAAIGLDSGMSRHAAYRLIAHGEEKPVSSYVESLRNYGHVMEPKAINYVEQVSKELIFFTGDTQEQHRRERYTCHPDGIIDDDQIVEVKSRQPGREAYVQGDKNWNKHMAQVQQNLWITDSQVCWFACYVWNDGKDGQSRLWKVHRSDEYIDRLHSLLREFCRYVDGHAPCPRKIKSKPKMPSVVADLLDGPVEPDGEEHTQAVVESIAKERSKGLTIEELNELEEQLLKEHPGQCKAILRGTKERREQLQ